MSGEGQIVVLEGEPGIGKTRLTEELAHFAGMSGATVLWARCHDAEGSPAFWPWSQIVRNSLRNTSPDELRELIADEAGPIAQVVPEIRSIIPDSSILAVLNPDQARFRFFDSLTVFLVRLSERHLLVIIIEDLHWADRSSLMLLEFMADEIAQRRIMLVVTCRAAPVGDTVPLIRALERLNRSRVTQRVQVTGLDLDDTARFSGLIAGRPLPMHLVETIFQRTSGNPFFLREVTQLLVKEGQDLDASDPNQWQVAIPVGVREAVTLRLSELSDDARRLLIDAAVIGNEFQLDLLAAMNDTSTNDLLDLLEEAVSLGVVAEDQHVPDRFRFTHVLTQQTLYEGLIVARRARMHARVGDALERLRGSSADPPYSELARHFYLAAAAGEAERAVTYLTRAGEQSMERLAYAEAVEQFRRAVEVLDRFTPERQSTLFDLFLDLSRAQLASGESSDGRVSRLRSIDVARAIRDPERLALAAIEMVDTASGSMDWRATEEIALLREALAGLPEDDGPLQTRVMSELAHALVFDKTQAGSADLATEREKLVQDSLAMARRIGAPDLIADALRAAHVVLWTYEDVDARMDIANELLTLATKSGDPQMQLAARAQLIGGLFIKGMINDADREIDAYEILAQTYQLPVNIWSVTAKRAMRAFMRGDLRESESLLERARVIGRRSAPEVSQLNYLVQLYFLRREQDRLNEVEELLTGEAVNHPEEALWQCLLAVLYADTGRQDEASKFIAKLLDQPDNTLPRDSFWLALLVLIADACATIADSEHAATLLVLLRPYADLFVCPGNHVIFLGHVSHYLGCLSATLEQLPDAEAYFQMAIKAERAAGIPVFEGRSQLAYLSMLAKQGAETDTVTMLLDRVRETSSRHQFARLGRLAREVQESLPTCHSP